MQSSPESDGGTSAVDKQEQEQAHEHQAQEREPGAELAQMEDRWKRALADLDNYRKRAARELEGRLTENKEALIRDWLDAVDSVDRALAIHAEAGNPVAEGLRAVLEQMEAILERQGVTRVGEPGERFDPERHEAISVRVTDDVPDHTVLDVARSGYALGDRVIRPAQVVVSQVPRTEG
jgi:molecular chaperone GrpE